MAHLRGAWLMRFLAYGLLGSAAIGTALLSAGAANAATISDVPWIIQNSGGRYVYAGASLSGADCSGLVSVAQSLAMGQSPRRLGNTHSLLAGNWPGAVPGARPGDPFVIGVNAGHMVAQINGVNIEATTSGQPYKVGAAAASPWSGQFRLYHIDPSLLRLPGPVQAPEPPAAPVVEGAAPQVPPPPPPPVGVVLPSPPPPELPVEPMELLPPPPPVETFPPPPPLPEVAPPPLP